MFTVCDVSGVSSRPQLPMLSRLQADRNPLCLDMRRAPLRGALSQEIDNTFYLPAASLDVTGEYQDRIKLVGEGDLPFGSVNLNLKLKGSFISTISDPNSGQQARASVHIKNKDTCALFPAEYTRGFGEEKGIGSINATLPLQKILGVDGDATLRADFNAKGFANSVLQLPSISLTLLLWSPSHFQMARPPNRTALRSFSISEHGIGAGVIQSMGKKIPGP